MAGTSRSTGPTVPPEATNPNLTDHGAHSMPGMATEAEVARLAAATGAEADRLFLTLMIRHHQGALSMVEEHSDNPMAERVEETGRRHLGDPDQADHADAGDARAPDLTQVPDVQCSRASLDHGHAVSLEDSGGGRTAATASDAVGRGGGRRSRASSGSRPSRTRASRPERRAATSSTRRRRRSRRRSPSTCATSRPTRAASTTSTTPSACRSRPGPRTSGHAAAASSLPVSLEGHRGPLDQAGDGSPSPTCSTGARRTIVLTFDVPGEKPRSKDSTRVGPGYATLRRVRRRRLRAQPREPAPRPHPAGPARARTARAQD